MKYLVLALLAFCAPAIADDAAETPVIISDTSGNMAVAYAHVNLSGNKPPVVCFMKAADTTRMDCLVPQDDGSLIVVAAKRAEAT